MTTNTTLMLLVVGMAARINRPKRGAIYARHSTGFQKSVPDQVRECLAWAQANGITVAEDMIFRDEGISGRSDKRPGLEALITALEQNQVDVVIVLQTNRLYRKLYAILRFVAEQIVDCKKRLVFVSQAIDTDEDGERWEYLLPVLGLIDSLRSKMSKANIQSAHKGLHKSRRQWGTRTFGYRGRPVEGVMTNRGRPAQTWAIDETESQWVRRIYDWFVRHELSVEEIARRLNRELAPLSPKCVTGQWTRQAVMGVLKNPRYVGRWPYGAEETIWQNRASYGRQVAREMPLDLQVFDDLRLIDDATWAAALQHWYAAHDQPMPDGRVRRSQLTQKRLMPTKAEDPQVIEKVMRLFEGGVLYGEIAAKLGLGRNTITKIIRAWHEAQGRAVPDGRGRRKQLTRLSRT
ncbi:recombinase family protein [Phycisphaerales bacterium AB-hyl4]|uniref:Recombinase family protein n=1 Tax=Natronomicrosphaera hydrolytica TaxID=3242702 RepID=A0ABV4UBG0_9BACT